ncbi:MAG: alkaline phosphatase family protein [Caldilineaceae bacterium]|nr:alkaline phosphatase family protein [Caldilineaceae bacterium]
MSNENTTEKVVVIGWDAATFDVLQPLLEAGTLPNLQKLMARGTAGKLLSTLQPLTPPAWTTFMTGVNPGKHGIFDFIGLNSQGHFQVLTGADVRAETLWMRLSKVGKRVLVANVPMTYPPEAVNGTLIAGMDAPRHDLAYTHPAKLSEEIAQRFGEYRVDVKAGAPAGMDSASFTQQYVEALCAQTEQQGAVADYLFAREVPDFSMVVFTAPDRVQHALGHLLAQGVTPTDGIGLVYRACDEALGRLLRHFDEHCSILLVSDHGACTYERVFELGTWLASQGWLTLAPPARLERWHELWGRVQRQFARWLHLPIRQRPGLQQFLQQIVWEKSRAFSMGAFGNIYIATAERFAQGIVKSQAEYEAICEQITTQLLAAKDPETGAPIVKAVHRADAVYTGPYRALAPDLLVETHTNYFVRNQLDHNEARLTYPAGNYGERALAHTGRHHPEGVLVAAGPAFQKQGQGLSAQLADLAPTILHLMGQAVPSTMDGQVLQRWFTPAYQAAHPIQSTGETDAAPTQLGVAYSQEEQQVVQQRLRDLGYLD